MSAYKARIIEAALLAKGFQNIAAPHHEMYWLYVGGKKTGVRTRISRGIKEYGDDLLGAMARQLRVRRAELDDLILCPMSAGDYVELLREHGDVRQGG